VREIPGKILRTEQYLHFLLDTIIFFHVGAFFLQLAEEYSLPYDKGNTGIWKKF
jgi:hypothetical protein